MKRRLSYFSRSEGEIVHSADKTWITILPHIFRRYEVSSFQPNNLQKETNPFRAFLSPFVDHGTAELLKSEVCTNKCFTAIHSTLIKILLDELTYIASDCFWNKYLEYADEKNGTSAKEMLIAFGHSFYSIGYLDFFSKYASLARLLVITVEKWKIKCNLFCTRFLKDYQEIQNLLEPYNKGLKIVQIDILSTSSHSQEGNNLLIHFDAGQKVIYKPKSGSTDLIYQGILEWYNQNSSSLKLDGFKVIDKIKYSWHEYVPIKECQTRNKVNRYYFRIGILSALFQACGSRDYHFENVRSSGEFPICTDNESILCPQIVLQKFNNTLGDSRLAASLYNSPANAGLISSHLHSIYPNPPSIDGAFEDSDPYSITIYRLDEHFRVQKENSFKDRIGDNIPTLSNSKVDPHHFKKQIEKGYHEAISVLRQNIPSFWDKLSIISNGWDTEIRVLLRPSILYAQIMQESLQAKYLQSGVDRSIFFERLSHHFIQADDPEQGRNLLNKELSMLLEFYSPWFHLKTTKNDFAMSPPIISHHSFSAKEVCRINLDLIKNLPDTQFIFRLQALLPDIHSRYSDSLSGYLKRIVEKTMLTYEHYTDPDYLKKHSISGYFDIMNGMGGIAIMYAGAYHVFKEQRFKNAAYQFLVPLLDHIQKDTGLDYSTSNEYAGARYTLDFCRRLGIEGLPLFEYNEILDTFLIIAKPTKFRIPLNGTAESERLVTDLIQEHAEKDESEKLFSILSLRLISQNRHFNLDLQTKEVIQKLYDDLLNKLKSVYLDLSLWNGISGITLQALILGKVLDNSIDYEITDLFLQRLASLPEEFPENIKYGLSGWIETYLELDQNTDQALLIEKAILLKLKKDRKFDLRPNYHDLSFFNGVSGVVYNYLRLISKGQLPSVFSFDSI